MPNNPKKRLRKVVLTGVLVLLLALIVGSIAVRAGAGSLSAPDVRAGILALPKNQPFRDALIEVELPAGAADSGLVVRAAHFPATAGPQASPTSNEPPIVFVHGTPDTMGAWHPLLFGDGALAGSADIWAIEVIGHGMSADAEGPFPFQRCAEFVASALEALDLRGVTLVGNSYGGEFCWRAAVDRPDLVGRLVLIDSSGLPRSEDQFLSEEVKMRDWAVARYGYLLNSEERVKFALDPHFDGAADPGRVREVFLGLESSVNWNAMIDLVRDENGARAEDLAGLAMPTLLLWGETDQAYAPETFGKAFEEAIPDARLVVFEGAGHYPHEQEPAGVARELIAFHREGR